MRRVHVITPSVITPVGTMGTKYKLHSLTMMYFLDEVQLLISNLRKVRTGYIQCHNARGHYDTERYTTHTPFLHSLVTSINLFKKKKANSN